MLIQDLNHIETVQDNIRGGLLIASDATVTQAGYGLYGSAYTSSSFNSDYYYYKSAYTSGSASGSVYHGAQAVSASSLIVY